MKKLIALAILTLMLAACAFAALPASAADDFDGWTPISSGADFAKIASGASETTPNKYYLTTDITVNATVGSGWNPAPISNVIIDGNGKSITLSKSLFIRVNNFTMQNVTLKGKIVWNSEPFMKSPITSGNGDTVGKITLTNVTSEVDMEVCFNHRYKRLAGVIYYTGSGSVLTNVKYTGNITVKNSSSIESKIEVVGGIVANAISTRFENCVNEGDLSVTVIGPEKKTTVSAVGGICGLVVLDGVVFDGCSNSGNISRISSGEGSNDGTSCVGGILGQAVAAYGSSNPHAIDATKGFNTQILNCTNSGTILHNARYSAAIEIASGKDGKANRHATAGGIVGLINGRSDAKATVSGCTNTGTVTDGWIDQRHFVGGISGYSQYATFTNNVMTGCLSSYNGLSLGVAGGIVGAAYEGVTISGGSSKPSFDCIGKNTVDFCDGLCVGVSLGNVSVSNVKVGVGPTAKIVDRGVERTITKDNYSIFKELVSTTTVGENTTYATTVTNVTWEE